MKKLVSFFKVLFVFLLFNSCVSQVQQVEVHPSNLEITQLPTKLDYKINEYTDYTGLSVKLNYTDGSSKTLALRDMTLEPKAGSILKTVGSNPIKITSNEKTVFFLINVSEDQEPLYSAGLEIASLPTTLNYFTNGKLDLTGLVVKMNKTDGSQVTLSESEYTVEPSDGSVLTEEGYHAIKVVAEGRTAYFSIYVGKTAFTGLKITNLPDKIWYEDNEVFDTTGLEVTAVFNDGKDNQNRVLEEWEYKLDIKNGSALEAGSGQKVTVSYCGKTASFIINVGSTWETYEFTDDGTHILSDICMNNTNLRSVTIPDTITEIPAYAFYGCTALESITLPASVRYVHKRAFKDCISLQNLIIEPRTEWLDFEEESFSNCVSLQNVDFENAAGVSLKTRSFEKCNSLVKIDFKTSVRGEYQYAFEKSGVAPFYNCENLEEVNFNNLNDFVYESFFFESCPKLKTIQNLNCLIRINYCPSITQIEIPQNQDSTPERWLQGCTGLAEIDIPSGYKKIAHDSFKDCTSLASITIPNSVTTIGYNAFQNCTSLEQIQLPPKLETIDYDLFSGCKNLKSIEIPSLVENIKPHAFKDCTSLKSITIPNSVTSIEDGAFENCTSLTSVTIPNSVTDIDLLDTFKNCTSLEQIIYDGTKSDFSALFGYTEDLLGVQILCNDGTFIYGEKL